MLTICLRLSGSILLSWSNFFVARCKLKGRWMLRLPFYRRWCLMRKWFSRYTKQKFPSHFTWSVKALVPLSKSTMTATLTSCSKNNAQQAWTMEFFTLSYRYWSLMTESGSSSQAATSMSMTGIEWVKLYGFRIFIGRACWISLRSQNLRSTLSHS